MSTDRITGASPTRCCKGRWPRPAIRRSGRPGHCAADRRRPSAADSTPAGRPRTLRWRPRGRLDSAEAARARPAAVNGSSVVRPFGSPAPVSGGRRSCPTAGRPRRPLWVDSTTGHRRRRPLFRPTGRCRGAGSQRPRPLHRSRRCTSLRAANGGDWWWLIGTSVVRHFQFRLTIRGTSAANNRTVMIYD